MFKFTFSQKKDLGRVQWLRCVESLVQFAVQLITMAECQAWFVSVALDTFKTFLKIQHSKVSHDWRTRSGRSWVSKKSSKKRKFLFCNFPSCNRLKVCQHKVTIDTKSLYIMSPNHRLYPSLSFHCFLKNYQEHSSGEIRVGKLHSLETAKGIRRSSEREESYVSFEKTFYVSCFFIIRVSPIFLVSSTRFPISKSHNM